MRRSDFIKEVYSRISVKHTPSLVAFGVAWCAIEGSKAHNNPLDTTEPWEGATNFNDVGVKNYPTTEDGIKATVATLNNGDYHYLLETLRNPDSDVIDYIRALNMSPWGSKVSAALYQDVKERWGEYDTEVVDSTTAPKPEPAPQAISDKFPNSAWSTTSEWSAWMLPQLEGEGIDTQDAAFGLLDYLTDKEVTDQQVANNLEDMIFQSGTLDKRYVPPLDPVPHVKGANPDLLAALASAIQSGDTTLENTIKKELGFPSETVAPKASTETEKVVDTETPQEDTLEARLAAADPVEAAAQAAKAAEATAPVISTPTPVVDTPASPTDTGTVDTLEARMAAFEAAQKLASAPVEQAVTPEVAPANDWQTTIESRLSSVEGALQNFLAAHGA